LYAHEQGERADDHDQQRQHPNEEPFEEALDRQHAGILSKGPRASTGPAPGRALSSGLCCLAMDRPTEDAKRTPENESDETVPANEVESYESEWYEVLKRRAEELESDGESAEGETEDEGEDAEA
jgi:hypothetical protein